MYHILYNPGAGGDMIAAVIDSKDHFITDFDVQCTPGTLRYQLKQDLITNHGARNLLYYGFEKTEYFKELEQNYLAITASHNFAEELHYITDTILIDDSEYKYAKWCMERCHTILPRFHPPFSDEEVKNRIRAVNTAKKYGKINKVIPFKDVLEGRLIEKLQQWIDTPLNTEIYNHWLTTIISTLPKVD